MTPFVSPLADVELPANDSDPFARLEKQLRESEEPQPREDPEVLEQLQRDQHVMADLEDWLAAIVNDRNNQAIGVMHVAPGTASSRAPRGPPQSTCTRPASTRCS